MERSLAHLPIAKTLSYGKDLDNEEIEVEGELVTANETIHYNDTETVSGYYLDEVINPGAPHEEYKYSHRENDDLLHLTLRKRPKHRYLETEYYKKGYNHAGGNIGKLKLDKKDFRIDRVMKQKAPVGEDAEPIIIYRFDYHAEIKKHHDEQDEAKDGRTIVYDAEGHKTAYSYDPNHRIKKIIKFNGTTKNDYSQYSFESFIWGDKKDDCNLKTKFLADAQTEKVHHGYHFKYDNEGNTKVKTLFGKLTGRQSSDIRLNKNNKPIDDGYEQENTTYTYSKMLNLIRSETNSNGKKIEYKYCKGTDAIKCKFVHYDNKIQMREFYYYNDDYVLIKKIQDNGEGKSHNDMTCVTQRLITYYTPREKIPYGLPKYIDEMYLDLRTNQEILLKRTVNKYSRQGHLLKEFVFDASRQLAYENSWDYDAHGNVIKETNALGETIRKEYDENDNLIYQYGPHPDYVLQNSYDFSNRLVEQKETHSDGSSFVKTNKYNYLSQRKSSTDHFGNKTHYEYNDIGQAIAKVLPAVLNEDGNTINPTIQLEYDIVGHITKVMDPLGRITVCENNIRGKPLVITYPDGTQERFYYRLDGQLTEKIDTNGTKVVYTLDPEGRPTKEEFFGTDGHIEKWIERKYNAFSLLNETFSDGLTIDYTYDYAGRPAETRKNNVPIQKQFFDSLGRVNRIHDWYDSDHYRVTIKEYDLLNRIKKEQIETQEGEVLYVEEYDYDCLGNKTRIKIGDQETRTLYNSYNKPIRIIDEMGNTTHISYNLTALNELDQLVLEVTTTDPVGIQTIEQYDALNRLVKTTRKNPFGRILSNRRVFYDLCDNKKRIEEDVIYSGRVDKTTKTIYHYDPSYRIVKLIEAADTQEMRITSYKYDSYGQKKEKIKPDGIHIAYSYDTLGRLKEYQASDHSFHYLYEYDQRDNLINVSDLICNRSNHRSYNDFNQLVEETLGNGLTIHFENDLFDRNTRITLPDQSQIEYVYNAANLKEAHRIVDNTRIYSHYNDQYDNAGLITLERRAGRVGTQSRQYDKMGRCISLNAHSLSQNVPNNGFDAVSNLKRYFTNGKECLFEYDELNQITSEKAHVYHQYTHDSLSNRRMRDNVNHEMNHLHQVLTRGTDELTYDHNGNLKTVKTSEGVTNYSYDALDRLISVEKNRVTTSYEYDSFNRRIAKIGDNEPVIYYLYLDLEEFGSWQNGKISELKLLNESHRETIAIELNHVPYVPIRDLFGNVVRLIDLDGNLIENYHYSVFGEVTIMDNKDQPLNNASSPWLYSNRRYDYESELYVFNLRYYDPKQGRWITPDPAGYEEGPNLYAHVLNNPFKYYDLLGLTLMPNSSTVASAFAPVARGIQSCFTNTDPVDASGIYSINSITDPETGKKFNYPFPKDFFLVYVCGIGTAKADFDSNMAHFAKTNDHHVYGVFDCTQGLAKDSFTYFKLLWSDHESTGVKNCKELHTLLNEAFPRMDIITTPHSRGCVVMRNSFNNLPKKIGDKTSVLAIAPGAYLDKKMFKRVEHIACDGDPVPKLDYFGRKQCNETITIVSTPGWSPLSKHNFTNQVYTEPTQQFIADYKNNRGL